MTGSLLLLADAAAEGRSIVLMMLATGGVFLAVIALGELSHLVAARRRTRKTRTL